MNTIVVLGAGVAGISATYHLPPDKFKVSCYESSNITGGLLAPFFVGNFRFDRAVHLSFTKDKYVRSLFDNVKHYKHRPDSYCYESEIWLRHPVQNNLFPLSTEEKVELISSFCEAPKSYNDNYQSWLISQYGQKIAERYPIKYTQRYWSIDADKLSLTWIGNRLRKANLSEILYGAFEPRYDNHYYADEMRYPTEGGYFSFIKPMVSQCDIHLDKKAIELDLISKKVRFNDGDIVAYDNIISSIPLPELIGIINDVPEDVKKAAESLLYTKIDLLSVGFSREISNKYLWFYIYDDCVAARAYSPSLKSPDAVPKGCSSLQFEVYTLSTKSNPNISMLIENIRSYLIKSKICGESDILFIDHRQLKYGNVVYDHGMEERRQLVLDFLKENNIETCGRFGEWSYLWSDQSLLSGKDAANRVINGSKFPQA
ncbi:protoporphyrinogen/coproporphyrinogen oxidase [Photorhabdus bodei]|uniref:protoporphyrinogen/coproporphyrinogen oxidase n=1 Tax=Photorhabdus bodei TaxID=2029681 RepID=UPI001389A6A1|nr:NAD(P)-binding protein [Photorhabdus bodei]